MLTRRNRPEASSKALNSALWVCRSSALTWRIMSVPEEIRVPMSS